jgi:hypothetical protein
VREAGISCTKKRPIKSQQVHLMQVKKNKLRAERRNTITCRVCWRTLPAHCRGGGGSVERWGPLRSPFGSSTRSSHPPDVAGRVWGPLRSPFGSPCGWEGGGDPCGTHLSCMDLFANHHLQCEKPAELSVICTNCTPLNTVSAGSSIPGVNRVRKGKEKNQKNTAQMRHSCALSGLKA